MIYSKNQEKNVQSWQKKLKNFELKALNILLIGLMCSCCNLNQKKSMPNILQPNILKLTKGTKVETVDGNYVAQSDEVWHSDKRFRDLERTILYK